MQVDHFTCWTSHVLKSNSCSVWSKHLNFLNTHNRQPKACLWGQGMGCLLWVQNVIYAVPLSMLCQGSFCVCAQPMRDDGRYNVKSSLIGWAHILTDPCCAVSNETRRYNVTSSLIGWAHTQIDPCCAVCNVMFLVQLHFIKENISMAGFWLIEVDTIPFISV